MAGKTHDHSDRVLDLFLGQTVAGAAATYVNLFTANPAGDGSEGTEWSQARVQVHQSGSTKPHWSSKKSEANKRYVDNVGTISWTLPEGYTTNETVVGIGIFSTGTLNEADTLLYWEALSTNRTVAADDEIAFGTGALKVRED